LSINWHRFSLKHLCWHSITKILRNGPRTHFPFTCRRFCRPCRRRHYRCRPCRRRCYRRRRHPLAAVTAAFTAVTLATVVVATVALVVTVAATPPLGGVGGVCLIRGDPRLIRPTEPGALDGAPVCLGRGGEPMQSSESSDDAGGGLLRVLRVPKVLRGGTRGTFVLTVSAARPTMTPPASTHGWLEKDRAMKKKPADD
jgi:hypothetical protein